MVSAELTGVAFARMVVMAKRMASAVDEYILLIVKFLFMLIL